MGIYEQPNSWQCGPFALKHALLAYGVVAHEDALARAAGSSEVTGTDEKQLQRVARAYGCRLLIHRHYTAFTARRALRRLLAERTPVLLCVDQWDHWLVAVAADAHHVVVLDSHFESVVRVEPWRALMRRVRFREHPWTWGPPIDRYDLHPVVARGETGLRLALTPDRARRLLAQPATRRGLDAYAARFAPFAAHPSQRRSAVSVSGWLDVNRRRLSARIDDATIDAWMLAADAFGVYVAPARLPALAEQLAADASEPAPAVQVRPPSRVALSAAS